ncbi:hypothetical protein B0H63DRAFT_538195 [Podospora didyma]|uniref:Uncharacterized protein n=1 Tax=Podospora didyma TaxID=330526 RepID=A0AAE0U410_9PEZI|nr:hypothetical protein B0H63DRAFT_538195 [Podospora didyma]
MDDTPEAPPNPFMPPPPDATGSQSPPPADPNQIDYPQPEHLAVFPAEAPAPPAHFSPPAYSSPLAFSADPGDDFAVAMNHSQVPEQQQGPQGQLALQQQPAPQPALQNVDHALENYDPEDTDIFKSINTRTDLQLARLFWVVNQRLALTSNQSIPIFQPMTPEQREIYYRTLPEQIEDNHTLMQFLFYNGWRFISHEFHVWALDWSFSARTNRLFPAFANIKFTWPRPIETTAGQRSGNVAVPRPWSKEYAIFCSQMVGLGYILGVNPANPIYPPRPNDAPWDNAMAPAGAPPAAPPLALPPVTSVPLLEGIPEANGAHHQANGVNGIVPAEQRAGHANSVAANQHAAQTHGVVANQNAGQVNGIDPAHQQAADNNGMAAHHHHELQSHLTNEVIPAQQNDGFINGIAPGHQQPANNNGIANHHHEPENHQTSGLALAHQHAAEHNDTAAHQPAAHTNGIYWAHQAPGIPLQFHPELLQAQYQNDSHTNGVVNTQQQTGHTNGIAHTHLEAGQNGIMAGPQRPASNNNDNAAVAQQLLGRINTTLAQQPQPEM